MELIAQFAKFTGVGAVGTAAQYAFLILLVQSGLLHPVAASALGFVVGAVTNYALNYVYTFKSTRRHLEAAPRFFTVALIGLGINTFLIDMLITYPHAQYMLAQVIATGCVLFWNFGINRYWTFQYRAES